MRDGYIFVYQDVRGRNMSEGEFVNMRPHRRGQGGPGDVDESTDTYDTIEWLLAQRGQPQRPGRAVGQLLPRLLLLGGDDRQPPGAQGGVAQRADRRLVLGRHAPPRRLHPGARLQLLLGVRQAAARSRPPSGPSGSTTGPRTATSSSSTSARSSNVERPCFFKGECAFWNDIAAHPDYDEFWQSRNILPHLEKSRCAVLTVGGWFDAEDLYGPLHIYPSVERNNPGIFNVLVMGPWRHGAWLRPRTVSPRAGRVRLPHRRGVPERALSPSSATFSRTKASLDLPEAWMFETGANRWREFRPLAAGRDRDQSAVSAPGGGLWPRPAAGEDDDGFDEFPSDPAKPVPYTPEIARGWHAEYMVEDQRFAARRPDVLVYRSEPLEEDLTLAGPINATPVGRRPPARMPTGWSS